jgi:hypothetical protein
MSKQERASDNHGVLTMTHTTLRMSVPASQTSVWTGAW